MQKNLSSINATHNHVLHQAHSLEASLSTANKQNESLVREAAVLKQDLERTALLLKQAEKQREDVEKRLAVTQERLADVERRGRDESETGKKLSDELNHVKEEKVMFAFNVASFSCIVT